MRLPPGRGLDCSGATRSDRGDQAARHADIAHLEPKLVTVRICTLSVRRGSRARSAVAADQEDAEPLLDAMNQVGSDAALSALDAVEGGDRRV